MRAILKPENRYFCGMPGTFNGGLRMIRLLNAPNETAALFAYIEDRAKSHDPLKDGDEVVVVEAGASHSFTILDEPTDEETATVVAVND